MSLIFEKQVNKNVLILVWKIVEEVEYLKSEIYEQLNLDDKYYFENINNIRRRKEWLIVRILLKQKLENYECILYDFNNKPYLKSGIKISISNSVDFVGIILSSNQEVAIDIEQISERSEKIKHKFMSKNEIKNIDISDINLWYTILWSVKETLYKMYGEKNLIFNKNIIIQKFNLKLDNIIDGEIITKNFNKKYKINYFVIENNVLTWCN